MEWLCASLSEVLEFHPGYLDFGTSFDMLVSHSHVVTRSMEFVPSHTLPSGAVLKNFIFTDNGFLADTDLKKPGTKMFVITGYAKHSNLYHRLNPGDWFGFSWNYPNPKYSGIRAMVFSFALIVNPAQERDLLRGKMSLDFHPDILSPWCKVFLDCWHLFVDSNPCTKITDIYRTATGLFYGSPTDHAESYGLESYSGLPILLSFYHDRLAAIVRQIIIVSKQRVTDVDAHVPLGKLLSFVTIFHLLLLDCAEVQKYVDGRFGKTGRLVPINENPLSTFNLLLGKMVLILWEMVDTFNLLKLPCNNQQPLSRKWCLLDFAPKKVSSSNTSL